MRARSRSWTCVAVAGIVVASLAAPAVPQDGVPRYWAVVLGVDAYRDDRVPKVTGRRDATALLNQLRRSARFRIRSEATATESRDVIVQYLVDVAQEVGPNDTFILYFAGHGVLDPFSHQPFWLLRGTHLDSLEVQGLRLSHLVDYVSMIPAKHRLLVLDHCLAGEILRTMGVKGVTLEKLRAVEDEDASPRGTPPGLAVLGAAASIAKETTNGGVFTDVLLGALTSECTSNAPCADVDHNGKLSFEELLSYVKARFSEMAARDPLTQRPIIFVPNNAADWTLFDLTQTTDQQTRFGTELDAVVDDLENGSGQLGKDEASQARVAIGRWKMTVETPGVTLDDSAPTANIVRAIAEVASVDDGALFTAAEKAAVIRKALAPGPTP